MTRSRMALSTASSRAELRSSATLTESARTSASSPGASEAARSSRGRSRGSTQTAGSTPPAAIDRSTRSAATAPPDRSMTVTSPPAASRPAATIVSSADQPDSVPPATSTRSMPAGTGTPYQRFWVSKADRCRCHRLTSRACSACPAKCRLSWSARSRSTRCRSSSIRPRSTRFPCQIAYPASAAASSKTAMVGAATIARSRPPATQAQSASASASAAATITFSGRLIRLSSRRWAASQSADIGCHCCGTGRRGGGPGSGHGVAYSHPR